MPGAGLSEATLIVALDENNRGEKGGNEAIELIYEIKYGDRGWNRLRMGVRDGMLG